MARKLRACAPAEFARLRAGSDRVPPPVAPYAVAMRSRLANAEEDFDEDLIERLVEVAALRQLVE